MSSTNRGVHRNTFDAYLTPRWAVKRLLEEVNLPEGLWCDPCAGEGAIVRAINGLRPHTQEWALGEIRPECRPHLEELAGTRWVMGDYLEIARKPEHRALMYSMLQPQLQFDVLFTNPPFLHAMPFIEASFQWSAWVVMLLRLNFFGSAKRAPFFQKYAPDVYVLPDRPSFEGEGTDSVSYAWFVWPPERERKRGTLMTLATTPLEERQEDKKYNESLQVRNLVPYDPTEIHVLKEMYVRPEAQTQGSLTDNSVRVGDYEYCEDPT